MDTIDLSRISVRRLDEYFGLWAIEANRGLGMFDRAAKMNLLNHIETTEKPRPAAGIGSFRVISADPMPVDPGSSNDSTDDQSVADAPTGAGNIAVIRVDGTLMKQQSSMDESTSLVALRRTVRTAANDPRYQGIILCIDSPGGTCAGTADVAAAVAAAAEMKPVIAYVEDLCASAAYWIASQATEIYANHGTAEVGSIGTFIGTYDYSKWAENEGIQAKVYATGPLKGTGFPGAKITPEQDAYLQNIVDQTQRYFTQAVADGRGMSVESVSKLATGGVFMAAAALDEGLVDGIKSFDEVVMRMGELIRAKSAGSPAIQLDSSRGVSAESSKEVRMSKDATAAPAQGTEPAAPASVAESKVDPRTEAKRFAEMFGPQGAVMYAEGKTFEQAVKEHRVAQDTAIAELRQQLQAKDEVIKELRGEKTPVSASLPAEEGDKVPSKDPKSLASRIGSNHARLAADIAAAAPGVFPARK